MTTQIVEVTNGINWGKFLIGRFDTEWLRESDIDTLTPPLRRTALLRQVGWSDKHFLVLDLQTGEGATLLVTPSGHAVNDLSKHRIWVCPLFEPFLVWLYAHAADIHHLPRVVELPDAPAAMYDYVGRPIRRRIVTATMRIPDPTTTTPPRRRLSKPGAPSVTEHDAAMYTGLSWSWLRHARMNETGPPYYRLGRTIRYRVVDLNAWLAQHRVEPRG